jgi:hypothetical protein
MRGGGLGGWWGMGRLQKKLVVDGWWLLVNEGKRFRDGEMRALRAHGVGRWFS